MLQNNAAAHRGIRVPHRERLFLSLSGMSRIWRSCSTVGAVHGGRRDLPRLDAFGDTDGGEGQALATVGIKGDAAAP